mmetsp:Transcript_53650/g.99194  ORF Transcript_53650/g.99194 Transcript_53650/m.99194 type:complete len:240 (+) Transcript_53650:383-1102(+)
MKRLWSGSSVTVTSTLDTVGDSLGRWSRRPGAWRKGWPRWRGWRCAASGRRRLLVPSTSPSFSGRARARSLLLAARTSGLLWWHWHLCSGLRQPELETSTLWNCSHPWSAWKELRHLLVMPDTIALRWHLYTHWCRSIRCFLRGHLCSFRSTASQGCHGSSSCGCFRFLLLAVGVKQVERWPWLIELHTREGLWRRQRLHTHTNRWWETGLVLCGFSSIAASGPTVHLGMRRPRPRCRG